MRPEECPREVVLMRVRSAARLEELTKSAAASRAHWWEDAGKGARMMSFVHQIEERG